MYKRQVDISVYWIPVFDDEAIAVKTSFAGVKELYDRRIVKSLDGTNLEAVYADGTTESAGTGVGADLVSGDIDTGLAFDPTKVSLLTVSNPALTTRLFNYRGWLSWAGGDAYRSGPNARMRYLKRMTGTINAGVNAMTPGYVVWVLTIPPAAGSSDDFVTGIDGNYASGNAMADGGFFPTDFAQLGWLAPRRNPITGDLIAGDVSIDENDWARWSLKNNVAADNTDGDVDFGISDGSSVFGDNSATGGNRQWVPTALAVFMNHTVMFTQNITSRSMVQPN